MTDIVERAEAILKHGLIHPYTAATIKGLLAELKAARAENERLLRYITESRA